MSTLAPSRRAGMLWTLGLCVSTGLGCASTTGPSGQAAENEAARQRFRALVGGSYEYRFQQLCFCAPGVTAPVRIQVRDSRVESVTRVDDGQPVDPELLGSFPSVDDLFDEISEAIRTHAEVVEVDYDPTYGYPREVFIDVSRMIADEEKRYVASEMRPL